MNSNKVFTLLTTIYFLFCAWLYSLVQNEEVIQGMMLFTFLSFIILVCTDKEFWTTKSIRTFYRFWIIVDCIFVLIPYMFFTEDSLTFLNDYAKITDVEYRAVLVDEPGQVSKVSVTERITFDVHAISKNNLYWELWRDLPEIENEGVISKFDVKSVKQIKDDGSEIIFEESPRLYWEDEDYVNSNPELGPNKWFHSPGPYNEFYRQYECVFFYVDGIYQEKLTFEIEYEMTNPALRYLDCSELYLCLYSEETTKYLESYKAEILIDNKDMPSKGNYKTYTFGTTSNTFDYEESATKNPGYYTFSIELDEKDLKFTPANEYIEFSLVAFNEDKHKFAEYATINDYYFYNALSEVFEENDYYSNISKHYTKPRVITFLICSILSAFILVYTFKRDSRMRKKYNILAPTTEYKYFRDIPSNLDPVFASTLVFCKDGKEKIEDGFSAIMLSLIRKKYISVTRINPRKEWLSRNTKIQILQSANQAGIAEDAQNVIQELYNVDFAFEEKEETLTQIEPLTLSESYYLNLIKKHSFGLPITLHEFQRRISKDYVMTDVFIRNIDSVPLNVGINEGYFQNVQYKKYKKKSTSYSNKLFLLGILSLALNLFLYQTYFGLAYGSFIILGLTIIFSSLKIEKDSYKYISLTQFGEDEYQKWRGLYNFLNSSTLMNERTHIELPLWEKYLVYATAFGISNKVIKALKIRCPDIQESMMLSNTHYRSSHFRINTRRISNISRNTSRSYRSSLHSSSRGGWGYGSGGRGGGGGRRRSLIQNKKTLRKLRVFYFIHTFSK